MNDELPKKKRRWIPIVIGVLLLLCVLGAGAIVLTAVWFRQNISVAESNEDSALQQFDEIRSRFPGQQPLIQIVDNRPQYVPDRVSQPPSSTPLSTLHVIAFDRDEGKVVTFTLPFWVLRLKSGPIRISAYQQGWDDRGVSFRIEDIERHGPGIIVDASEPGEGRVLIWAE